MRRREGERGLLGGDGAGGGPEHYKMREQLLSFGDDFWIENERGRRAYFVDGKALRVRQTLIFKDADGRKELATIQEKLATIRDTMEIERDGRRLATVKKAMITPIRERYTIDVEGGREMEVKGNIVDHEYTIERDGRKVAEASKKWFRVADTYGIEIAPGEDEVLLLAAVVVIDSISHPGK
jgi:uncharacterized protein YxjI